MNLSNEGDCIHGREFCLECNDKKIPRRPESIGQAHRIMCQMRATIEQQQAEIVTLRNPWVSVEDRLPDTFMPFRELELAWFSGFEMCRCFGDYTEDGWYSGDESMDELISHWREPTHLPPAPSKPA